MIYISDAHFSEKCNDPALVAVLRQASVLIVHARTRNALTDAADIVLPVAPLSGKEGTFVNAKGLVQRVDTAIVSPPVVRTDLEVLLNLGARWEFPGQFKEAHNSAAVFLPNSVDPFGSTVGLSLKGLSAMVNSTTLGRNASLAYALVASEANSIKPVMIMITVPQLM